MESFLQKTAFDKTVANYDLTIRLYAAEKYVGEQ